MLVPCAAWPEPGGACTAEPSAAPACVAAAGGPRRAQSAALGAAAAFTAGFGVVGVIWELITFGVTRAPSTNSVLIGATLGDVRATGWASALICLLVGVRDRRDLQPAGDPAPGRQHAAPALARSRARTGLERVPGERRRAQRLRRKRSSSWPPRGSPVIAAIALLIAAWSVSALIAARRTG